MSTRAETFGLQLSALFESEHAGTHPQNELDPYSFSVLTVCTGNICRSPLMEALLRTHLSDTIAALHIDPGFLSVSSSGLNALSNEPADQHVRDLALALGTDVGSHRARQFEPEHAENAHLVLAATREQREHIVALAPSATTRVFTLTEFDAMLTRLTADGALEPPASPLHRPTRVSRRLQQIVGDAGVARQLHAANAHDDIDDPYRQSAEVHRRVADEIRTLSTSISAYLDRALR